MITSLDLIEAMTECLDAMPEHDFISGTDRVLSLLDKARNKVSSVEDRRTDPLLHEQVMAQCAEAAEELAATIHGSDELDATAAYEYLSREWGTTITRRQLRDALRDTSMRLHKRRAVAAE